MKSNNLPWLKKGAYIKAFYALFLTACIVPNLVFSQPFPYKFNYLTVDEGLSHTDANDIAQDKQGYIWIATYFGLDRFDGYAVKRFYNNNEPLHNAFKNRINHIYPDEEGNIWLGTEGGLQCFNVRLERYIDFKGIAKDRNPGFGKLYKPTGNFFCSIMDSRLRLFLIKGDSVEEQKLDMPPDVQVSDMAVDKNGLIWLTSNKGVWVVDKSQKCRNVPIAGLTRENIARIYFDNCNNLVLSAGNELMLVKATTGIGGLAAGTNLGVDKTFSWDKNSVLWETAQHGTGDYWVNTGNGLLRLDSNFNFIQDINNRGGSHYLSSNATNPILIDRSQCLWVCTFGGGVDYCDLNEKLFYTLQHNPEISNTLSGSHIRSVLEEGENLWVGTTANGLNCYNTKTQNFTYYNTYNSLVRLQNDVVSALAFDNDKNLWIGTSAGIEILKPNRKELWRPPGYDNFPAHVIESLVKDYYGNIWFGNHSDRFGVIWKDANNYYHVKYYGEGYFFLADSLKPQLFISSTRGLKRIIVDKEGNIIRSFDYVATANTTTLSSNYTYPVCKQDDSTYWVGTIGGGLDRLSINPKSNSYRVKAYTASYGIFNDVESLEIDNTGNIWVGGNGLQCLDPKTGKLIMYDKNDGLQGNSFKVGASYKGADGRLYFGGIRGLNYFYPEEIKTNNISAQPVLTDIVINNQKPVYGKAESSANSVAQAVGYSNDLTLSYMQNNFVISFSSMHYANPLKCRYRYKLIGFDKDWQYTDGKKPSAAYSNLDYSSYQFVVEATNNDGIWGGGQAATTITIIPPWWKSNTAKAIYVLLAISVLLGIYIYQARWYRLKRELAVSAVNEKKREEMHKQREELYQQQLMFFTNISHEFRTPLTLIMGPLEQLMGQNKSSVFDSSYQLIYRNAKRLINLVSELMNFKKVADSIIKLQVQPLEINQFCKNLTDEFQQLAIGKNIDFKLACYTENTETVPFTCLFDAQVLEKILFNLLNNAFKYTEEGGEVAFEVFFDIDRFKPSFTTGFQLLNEGYRAKKYIYFRVADTGIGISEDSLAKIFDRYYRISNNHLGSGVGLALVKSLTKLHKGDIYVYSERHKGTEIIIGIPWGEENYNDSERASLAINVEGRLEPIDTAVLLPWEINENGHPPAAPKSAKHILIVDDNQELRGFLKQAFEKHYHIYEAGDGNAAIEIAANKIPDLIISDVMMPGMNGIELCKLIKERFETSHIPFIILSAKDALGSKIEGMESGADFYFAKPLSVDLLLLTVNNIFEQAEKLKQRYTNNYLSEATELVHSEKDKEFLQILLTLIEEHIQEDGLDADFLCERLFISRTKLYQKIKSISDQSVGEFIRTIRLKKAIQIMTHEDIAMNEVADRVGLQSGSNFSRTFKKEYGKSPLQFMQALRKE